MSSYEREEIDGMLADLEDEPTLGDEFDGLPFDDVLDASGRLLDPVTLDDLN